MIIDARTIPDNDTVEAEICIIGGGAAGIMLAAKLNEHGLAGINEIWGA